MTEQEWLASAIPQPMLEFLRGKASDRKLRLFTVGCCRRFETDIPDQQSWDAVLTAEQFADGVESEQDVEVARKDMTEEARTDPGNAAVSAIAKNAWEGAFKVIDVVYWLGWEMFEEGDEIGEQVKLLHDIFGTFHFRPVTLDSAYRTPTVVVLAQSIYDNLSFNRMPSLADALEQTGCTDADILAHCRGPGPHVRGCWAVDLVLGKE